MMSAALPELDDAWPVPPQSTRLPYSFAKRHGLVLRIIDEENWCLLARPDWRLSSLAEARRLLGRPVYCRPVNETEFNEALAQSYQALAITSI